MEYYFRNESALIYLFEAYLFSITFLVSYLSNQGDTGHLFRLALLLRLDEKLVEKVNCFIHFCASNDAERNHWSSSGTIKIREVQPHDL